MFLQLNWQNDDASKDNLHFDDQSKQLASSFFVTVFSKGNKKTCSLCFYWVLETLVKVWENLKKGVVLPNFHSCFYTSIETRYMFYIFLNNDYLHFELGISSTGAQTRSALCRRFGSCLASSLSKNKRCITSDYTKTLSIIYWKD